MMEPESVRQLSFRRGWCAQWVEFDSVGAYLLNVLLGQLIKLIQVFSTSEFHEY